MSAVRIPMIRDNVVTAIVKNRPHVKLEDATSILGVAYGYIPSSKKVIGDTFSVKADRLVYRSAEDQWEPFANEYPF